MAYRTASQIGPPVSMTTGLSGCGKGMGCGCAGMGCAGLGLFDSGMDFTTWGAPEWGIVITGIYTLFSIFGDTKRGAQRVKGTVTGAYRGARSSGRDSGGSKRKRNPGRRRARR
jgi:hypothetical protein